MNLSFPQCLQRVVQIVSAAKIARHPVCTWRGDVMGSRNVRTVLMKKIVHGARWMNFNVKINSVCLRESIVMVYHFAMMSQIRVVSTVIPHCSVTYLVRAGCTAKGKFV